MAPSVGSQHALNPSIEPDYYKIRLLIVNAYKDDQLLDGVEYENLKRAGLTHDQVQIIKDTYFSQLSSPGELTSKERESYLKSGMGNLARLFDTDNADFSPQIKYWGGGPVYGWSRFVLHNPAKFEGAYPNDVSRMKGIDIALGVGQKDRRERSIFRDPIGIQGEFHFTLLQGTTTDNISPDDVGLDEAIDLLEDEAQEETDKTIEQFEKEAQREADKEINGPYEAKTGRDPKIKVDLESPDVNLDDVEIDRLGVHREAKFTLGLLQWRRLAWQGLSFREGQWHLLDSYFSFGIGLMQTDTTVTLNDKTSKKSETAFLGRLAGELDVVRYQNSDWGIALRTGVGITAGEQGGVDFLLGLSLFQGRESFERGYYRIVENSPPFHAGAL